MQSKTAHSRFASVPFHVLLFMSWRNLLARKLRSSLTILGVVIGIGAIFFLLSLGLGLQNLVTKEVIGNASVRSIDIFSPNSRIVKLNNEQLQTIKNLPQITTLGASYSFASSIMFNRSEIDSIAYGIDIPYQQLSNLQVIKGHLLKKNELDNVFVNTALLAAIGIEDPGKALGKKIDLNIPLRETRNGEESTFERSFTIAGVINSGSGSEVFLPSTLLEQAGADQYSQAKLLVQETADVATIRKQIESLGFETTSPVDTIDEINQIFKYFNIILAGFGAIGMIVAVLGMFNTLTISLLERTKETGLMIALGGRRKDMRILFILEAMLLSLIGSIIGVFLAILGGWGVNFLMNSIASRRGVAQHFELFATPLWLIVSLILFMTLVGVLVVLLPARRAERINPINALRRE